MTPLVKEGFLGGSDRKESPCSTDLGSVLGLGRSPAEGNDYPTQYSCLKYSTERGAYRLQSMGLQIAGHNWATNTFILSLVKEHKTFSSVKWQNGENQSKYQLVYKLDTNIWTQFDLIYQFLLEKYSLSPTYVKGIITRAGYSMMRRIEMVLQSSLGMGRFEWKGLEIMQLRWMTFQ